jgi:CheY-like chemotaxis protein
MNAETHWMLRRMSLARTQAINSEVSNMAELDLNHRIALDTRPGRLGESPENSHMFPRKYGILVADDNDGVRRVLNASLRRRGFEVWLAADGPETLDLYWRYRALIDLVLLDVRMPKLDGPRTLAALQQVNPGIRCCFMSGNLGDYTKESLYDLGAAALFEKPFLVAGADQVLWELASKADLSLATAVNGGQLSIGHGTTNGWGP